MDLLTDSNLSLKAKGLYYELLKLGTDSVTQRKLVKINSDGMGSVRTAINELRRCKLLKIKRLDFNKVRYELKRSDNSRVRLVTKMIIKVLRQNKIISSSHVMHDNQILKFVRKGYKLYDFLNAIDIMFHIENLRLSKAYMAEYQQSNNLPNPYVNNEYYYMLHIIQKGEIPDDSANVGYLDLEYMTPVSLAKIKRFKKQARKQYKDAKATAKINHHYFYGTPEKMPDTWVLNRRLKSLDNSIVGTKAMKYYHKHYGYGI